MATAFPVASLMVTTELESAGRAGVRDEHAEDYGDDHEQRPEELQTERPRTSVQTTEAAR